jgi:hypothetical protein
VYGSVRLCYLSPGMRSFFGLVDSLDACQFVFWKESVTYFQTTLQRSDSMYYHIEPNHSSYKFIHKTGQVFNSIEHSYIMFIPDTNRTDVTLLQAVTVWWFIIIIVIVVGFVEIPGPHLSARRPLPQHRPGKWLIRRAKHCATWLELPKKLGWLAFSYK